MKQLFQPIDIASLVFFRVVFGILAFADVFGTWTYKHLYMKAFDPDKFHFKYYGFEWVHPLPEPFMSIVFIVVMIAAILVALGKWYKPATLVFAFGFAYFFLIEKGYYLNHAYLFIWISFAMFFLPTNRAYSLDVLKKPSLHVDKIPYCYLFILQFMMGVVYFFGGIAKVNKDWLNGLPLKIWLKQKDDMPILGWLWGQEWVAYFMSYGGMCLDLFIVFLLIYKRTRWLALALLVFFHLTNLIVFLIGIFPYLSIALSLLFFEPDFPRKTIATIKRFFSKGVGLKFNKLLDKNFLTRGIKEECTTISKKYQSLTPFTKVVYNPIYKKTIVAVLVFVCSIHILLPLRHHYFPGDVAWTEEGHRYSWRMMLRSKQGYGSFKVKESKTGKSKRIKPKDYLSKRQSQKIYGHPDMILQFAHYIRDLKEAEGMEDVAVYADIKLKLNGRDYKRFIDPKVDLAKEEWEFFKASHWIMPMDSEQ